MNPRGSPEAVPIPPGASGQLAAVRPLSALIACPVQSRLARLVLAGIGVGAVIGLVSHNARLVLDEGSVPTAVFGVICLGSLGTPKPLMYRLAVEFIGPDTPKGQEFTGLWQYAEFRRVFRVVTAVWGIGYLAEAVARVVIVQNTSTGTALAVSKVLPYAVAAVLSAWTIGYGRYHKRKGEQLAAAAAAADAAGRKSLPGGSQIC
jgi:hypothetical protein